MDTYRECIPRESSMYCVSHVGYTNIEYMSDSYGIHWQYVSQMYSVVSRLYSVVSSVFRTWAVAMRVSWYVSRGYMYRTCIAYIEIHIGRAIRVGYMRDTC